MARFLFGFWFGLFWLLNYRGLFCHGALYDRSQYGAEKLDGRRRPGIYLRGEFGELGRFSLDVIDFLSGELGITNRTKTTADNADNDRSHIGKVDSCFDRLFSGRESGWSFGGMKAWLFRRSLRHGLKLFGFCKNRGFAHADVFNARSNGRSPRSISGPRSHKAITNRRIPSVRRRFLSLLPLCFLFFIDNHLRDSGGANSIMFGGGGSRQPLARLYLFHKFSVFAGS